jgi:opacity protein-like surface antigen
MKKILTLLAVSSFATLNIYAGEMEHHAAHEESKTPFYVAVKAITTLGDSIEEEGATLEGDTGFGIGIDLGYKLAYGFAIELDATYVTNNVTEREADGESEEYSASYITTSLDIAYKYPLTHTVGLVAKCGYEYEIETIDDLNIDNSETGFVFAGAVEYEMSEHIALLGEYEYTTIDGPRGNSIFAGLVYSF